MEDPAEFVPKYIIDLPQLDKEMSNLLSKVREKLVSTVSIKTSEILDPRSLKEVKQRFRRESAKIMEEKYHLLPDKIAVFSGILVHQMLGLGQLELLLNDENLEEIVINGDKEPAWVYHRKFGWLKTNIKLTEPQIENYAIRIGRRVGRTLTVLDPLMDAHMTTGDRVNATLFPISTCGHTITIRKFSRVPWTIVDLIQKKVLDLATAAFLWTAIENETSILVAGGTASGKTTLLNILMPFIPPNQRVLTIEDTRELVLPKFLHWVPLTTRQPNPEGKGGVSMLDLLVNSLRMRPDRIVVGEIRRAKEAQVLFEAIHTGHSVYATFHAENAEQAITRLTSPPIMVPKPMIESLPLMAVVFRQRKLGIRRIFQIAEVLSGPEINTVYQWKARDDKIHLTGKSKRIFHDVEMHTGLTQKELGQELYIKQQILSWLTKASLSNVNAIGKIISTYYLNKNDVIAAMKKNADPKILLTPDILHELGMRK
jgi:flagellar protein FlaI